MTEIKIVSGLNYGDESKGLVANAVSIPNSLTIMPSNSCQRAHTVQFKGTTRIFRHFGSGTLKGAATYFAKDFLCNPALFRKEYEELESLGIKPKVFYRAGGVIVTPMDMFANVQLEKSRGEGSFSSTGCGVWETLKRNSYFRSVNELKDCYRLEDIKLYYERIFKQKKIESVETIEFLNGRFLFENIKSDLDFFFSHCTPITSDWEEKELFHSYPLLVFENGQGLLLSDEYCYDYIHNTPAWVGAKVPIKLISQHFNSDEVKVESLYVTRTYYTRHGKGQIGVYSDCSCEKESLNKEMFDATNVPNENQGTLRYGAFNKREADAAVIRALTDAGVHSGYGGIQVKPSIVITHANEFNDGILFDAAKQSKINTYFSDNKETIEEFDF